MVHIICIKISIIRSNEGIHKLRNFSEFNSFHFGRAWNNCINFTIFLVRNEAGFHIDINILLSDLQGHLVNINWKTGFSKNPNVQKRIFDEIEKMNDFSYEKIRDFKVSPESTDYKCLWAYQKLF